jgi:hypothetical protein
MPSITSVVARSNIGFCIYGVRCISVAYCSWV